MRHYFRMASVPLFLCAQAVSASLIQLEIDGNVTSVDSALSGLWQTGDTVSLRVLYDANSPVTGVCTATQCTYRGAILKYHLTAGIHSLSAVNLNTAFLLTRNNAPADEFILNNVDTNPPAVSGLNYSDTYLDLVDHSATMFDSVSIPEWLPPADYYSLTPFFISYNDPLINADSRVYFSVDSVKTNEIPTPSTLALFGLGLLALVEMRRKHL